jgi:hypothetical protein
MPKALLYSTACLVASMACSTEPATDAAAETAADQPAAVSFSQETDRIDVHLGGRPLTSFHYAATWDKPFLHPLRTSSGLVISRGYPVDPQPGEERDHEWHRGIWYGHGDVNGHDFWRELGRDKTGMIVPVSEPTFRTEEGQGTLSTELGLQSEVGQRIGTLRQDYRFSTSDGAIVLDATIAIRADQGQSLRFGDTDDGGLAVRLADAFRQDHGAVLQNSEGQEDTENIWGQAARWVDYSTTVDGKRVGATMFDHPSNLRHPTRWHARGYSLYSANPFATGSFTGDKGNDGSHTVPEGETITFQYRMILYEGHKAAEQIERLYGQYANGGTE